MGAGPVSATAAAAPAPAAPPGWKLAPGIAARTQGLVASGCAGLPFGRALFLALDEGIAGGASLRALAGLAPVTGGGGPPGRAAAMAFTHTVLRRMGLDEQALASSRPFREGMFQEDRLRRLGDRREGRWCQTVVNPDGAEPHFGHGLHACLGTALNHATLHRILKPLLARPDLRRAAGILGKLRKTGIFADRLTVRC